MISISKTVVFFGNERLATGVTTSAPTLRALIDNGYDVVAVVSNFETGTSRKARSLEIKEITDTHNIPLLLPKNPLDIAKQLKDYKAEIGILVAYGKIVPQSIIDIFPKGIINIHPSLLPLHRGSTPIESAILGGETKTGISIMQLEKAMDAGPVYAQQKIDLDDKVTKQVLADRLLNIGSDMIIDLIPKILDNSIKAKPQHEAHATYDNLIAKSDGLLDWSKPAVQLEREIRAYAAWPQSRTQLAGIDVVITKAHIAPGNGTPGRIKVMTNIKSLIVYCGSDSLCVDRLKPANKSDMDIKSFIAGYGDRLN